MNDQTDPADKTAFDADAYNATQSVVRRRLSIVEKSQEELKKLKEMLTSMLSNDEKYLEADAQVQEVQIKKKDEKARITGTTEAQNLLSKIKDLQIEIKENKRLLSEELMEYYKTAGVTEIEDEEGNVQEFEIVVKLKKKRTGS